jgi:GNAT superfamily N-acetyltransferase
MPSIEIAQATETEYPLLQTLRDTIFSEFCHASRTTIAQSLSHRQDVLALVAHLEGNPVGFCIGYQRAPGRFYINYLALLRDYRGNGIGKQMMLQQEAFARSKNYSQIQFNTFNHFPAMLRLGLALGYTPVGLEQHEGTSGDLAIRFGKSLQTPPNPPSKTAPISDPLKIPCDDANNLREALDRGHLIVGMLREPGGRLVLLFSHLT